MTTLGFQVKGLKQSQATIVGTLSRLEKNIGALTAIWETVSAASAKSAGRMVTENAKAQARIQADMRRTAQVNDEMQTRMQIARLNANTKVEIEMIRARAKIDAITASQTKAAEDRKYKEQLQTQRKSEALLKQTAAIEKREREKQVAIVQQVEKQKLVAIERAKKEEMAIASRQWNAYQKRLADEQKFRQQEKKLRDKATADAIKAEERKLAASQRVHAQMVSQALAAEQKRTKAAEVARARETAAAEKAAAAQAAIMASPFALFQKNMISSVSMFSQRMRTFGYLASASLTMPLVLFAKSAIQAARDYEFTIQKIVGLTGEAQSSVDSFKGQILELSKALGKKPVELGEALYYIASSGIKGAEAMQVLKLSAKAAASGMGETQTMANYLTSVLNAYRGTGLTAAYATDILVAGVREGKAEAEGFAAAMGSVAPLASKLGMSLDQVAGSMAAVTLTGSTAAQAATYLRGMLNVLLKETKQGEKAMATAGKKIDGLGVSYADLRDILREGGIVALMKKMNELTAAYGETLVSKVFPNIRAMLNILSLTGNNMEYNTELMKRITNSSGSLAKAFAAVSDTMKMKMDRALASLNISMIDLGTTMATIFIPILENIAKKVQDLMTWFKSLDESQQKHLLTLLKWAALLGPISMAISLLGYTLTGLMNIVNAVGRTFIAFSGIMEYTSISMMKAAWKTSVLRDNLLKLKVAFNVIKAALLTNPWGLAIIALTTLVTLTIKAIKKVRELNKEINTGGSVKYSMVEGLLGNTDEMLKAVDKMESIRNRMQSFKDLGMDIQGIKKPQSVSIVGYEEGGGIAGLLNEGLAEVQVNYEKLGQILRDTGKFSALALRQIQIDIDDTIDALKVRQQELESIGQKEIDADAYVIQLKEEKAKIIKKIATQQQFIAAQEAKGIHDNFGTNAYYLKRYQEMLRDKQAALTEFERNVKTSVSVEKGSLENSLIVLAQYRKDVIKLLGPFSPEELQKQQDKVTALDEIFDQLETGEKQIQNMKELTGGKGFDTAAAYASLYSNALQEVSKWTGLVTDDPRIKNLLSNWKKFGGELKSTGGGMEDLTTKANELHTQLKYLEQRSTIYTGFDENFNMEKEKLKLVEGVKTMFEQGVAEAMKTNTLETWIAQFNATIGKELFKDAAPVGFVNTLLAIIKLLHETADAANIGDKITADFKQAESIYLNYKQNLESMAKLRNLKPPTVDLDKMELEFYESTLKLILDNYAAVYEYFKTTEGLGLKDLEDLIANVSENIKKLRTNVINSDLKKTIELLNKEVESYDTVEGKLEVMNEQLQLLERITREMRKGIISGEISDDGSLKKMTDEILRLKGAIAGLENFQSVKYLTEMNNVLHGAASGAALFSGVINALENDLQLMSSNTNKSTEEFKQLAWSITSLKVAEQATAIISDSFIQLFDAVIDGAENMGEVLTNIFKNIAKQIVGALIRILVQQAVLAPFENLITGLLGKWQKAGESMVDVTAITTSKSLAQAKAYQALTSAVAGAAAMPFPVSMAAIPAAAAMVTGTLATGAGVLGALLSQAVKMKTGGVVPEGYPNDTFPALLTSGEMVVPEDRYKTAEELREIYREYLDAPRMTDRPPRIPHLALGGVVPPGYSNDTFPAYLSSGEAVIPLGNDNTGGNILKRLDDLIKATQENKFANDPIVKAMKEQGAAWNDYYNARTSYEQTIEEINKPVSIDPTKFFKLKDIENGQPGIRNGTIVYKDLVTDFAIAAAKENAPLIDALKNGLRESGMGHAVQEEYGMYKPQDVMQSWGSDFLKGLPLSFDQFRMQNSMVNPNYVEKGSMGYTIQEPQEVGYQSALKYGPKYADYLDSFKIDSTLFEPFRKEMRFLTQHLGQSYNPLEAGRMDRMQKEEKVIYNNKDFYDFADSVYRANQPNIAMGGKGMPMMTGVMNKGVSLLTKMFNKSKENVPATPTMTMLPEVVVTAERTKPDYTGMGIGFMKQPEWTGAKIGQAATETQYAKEAKDRINLWKQEADARHNFISDIGTNVATLATQFRFAGPEERVAGREWEGRWPATGKAAAWGLANELTGGVMTRLGKTFAQGIEPLVRTFAPLNDIPGLLTAAEMPAGIYKGMGNKINEKFWDIPGFTKDAPEKGFHAVYPYESHWSSKVIPEITEKRGDYSSGAAIKNPGFLNNMMIYKDITSRITKEEGLGAKDFLLVAAAMNRLSKPLQRIPYIQEQMKVAAEKIMYQDGDSKRSINQVLPVIKSIDPVRKTLAFMDTFKTLKFDLKNNFQETSLSEFPQRIKKEWTKLTNQFSATFESYEYTKTPQYYGSGWNTPNGRPSGEKSERDFIKAFIRQDYSGFEPAGPDVQKIFNEKFANVPYFMMEADAFNMQKPITELTALNRNIPLPLGLNEIMGFKNEGESLIKPIDDVAGHIGQLIKTTDGYIMKIQDYWQFGSNYVKRYGEGDYEGGVKQIGPTVKNLLVDKQAQLLNKIGKPFATVINQPIEMPNFGWINDPALANPSQLADNALKERAKFFIAQEPGLSSEAAGQASWGKNISSEIMDKITSTDLAGTENQGWWKIWNVLDDKITAYANKAKEYEIYAKSVQGPIAAEDVFSNIPSKKSAVSMDDLLSQLPSKKAEAAAAKAAWEKIWGVKETIGLSGLTAGGLALGSQAKAQEPLQGYKAADYASFVPSFNQGQENDALSNSVLQLGVVVERLDVATENLKVSTGNIGSFQFPMTDTFTSKLGGVTPGFQSPSIDIPQFGLPKPQGLSFGSTSVGDGGTFNSAEGINESTSALEKYFATMSQAEKTKAGLEGVASIFGTLAGATDGSAASWLSFTGTVVGTIPQILAGLSALTIAHRTKQSAAAGDAVAEAAAGSMAMGPILGIIMLAASVAAIIAAMASIPKMAKGGIVPPGFSNDTFPALLSSNEAVIPLDRFENRSGGFEGDVRFVIEQDKLVGILKKAEKKNKIY